jgi:hypothetical protein
MNKLIIIVGAGVVGAAIGYIGGKVLVKRLPDTFTFCGIRATRRAK